MIELTRLNGHPIVVDAELLKFVEQNPDTVITLVTGDKLVVREALPRSCAASSTIAAHSSPRFPFVRPRAQAG